MATTNDSNAKKNYTLAYSGNSKIAASLTKVCAQGGVGESLIRNGLNQGTFARFLSHLAHKAVDAGRTETELAAMFERVSATNASAAQKALGDVELTLEGAAKPMSVSAFWGKLPASEGGAPDTSLFDL